MFSPLNDYLNISEQYGWKVEYILNLKVSEYKTILKFRAWEQHFNSEYQKARERRRPKNK